MGKGGTLLPSEWCWWWCGCWWIKSTELLWNKSSDECCRPWGDGCCNISLDNRKSSVIRTRQQSFWASNGHRGRITSRVRHVHRHGDHHARKRKHTTNSVRMARGAKFKKRNRSDEPAGEHVISRVANRRLTCRQPTSVPFISKAPWAPSG